MTATLVVEDGTAKTTSNSFVDVSTFVSYCDNHGYDLTGQTSNTETVALILAAEYLRNEARFFWKGLRVADDQRLSWPRSGVIVRFGTGTELANNVIPGAVKDAQCELAFKALTTTLQPDLERGGGIASVAAGNVSVSFREDALAETLIQVANGILKPYLRRYDQLPIDPYHDIDQRGYSDQSYVTSADGVDTRPGIDDIA